MENQRRTPPATSTVDGARSWAGMEMTPGFDEPGQREHLSVFPSHGMTEAPVFTTSAGGPPVLTLAGLLLRGRAAAGRAVIDILTVVTFVVSTSLLLSVVAGARAFYERQMNPPQGLLDALGAEASSVVAQLPMWTYFAALAAVLLAVPLMTLSAAAARMGALGRDQRLATLRLLGVTGAGVVRLAASETMASAALGALLGVGGYFALLPVWTSLTFQATPLTLAEMTLPVGWLLAVVVGVVVLAGVASVTGLRQVRISPLGVSRRAARRGIKWQRIIAVPVVVVVWAIASTMFGVAPTRSVVIGGVFVILVGFLWVVNLVGPLVLQLVGSLLARRDRASSLLAGRRLLDDPRAAWRDVAGLASTGFLGGALVALPKVGGSSAASILFIDDVRTGAVLAVAIAFVTAAASTALNQVASVLDRQRVLVQLDRVGTPPAVIHSSRRQSVFLPTLVASLGSAALASLFFIRLGIAVGITRDGLTGIAALIAILLAGVGLVVAASEFCRPVVRQVLRQAA